MKKLLFPSILGLACVALYSFRNQAQTQAMPIFAGDSTFNFSWETDNTQFGTDQQFVYLYTELNGGKAPENPLRKALNLALVIDRSGSMMGTKMTYALKAAKTLVQNLQVGDHFALVDYDEAISTPVFSTTIGENKSQIIKEIEKLYARGSTNLCGGMLEGFTQAKVHYNKDEINRVILFSDGLANVGVSDNESIQKMAHNKLEETGISLSTFGIGADYNEQLMTHLAEYGNGNYYFIGNADEIPNHLAAELQGLLHTVAQNVKLKINLPEQFLAVEKVYGASYKIENGVLIVDGGSVVAEETKPIMIKLRMKNMAAPTVQFTAKMSYQNGQTGAEHECSREFTSSFNQNKEEVVSHRNNHVWNAVQQYDLNDIMEAALHEMERGNQAKANRMLDTIYTANYRGFVSDSSVYYTNATVVQQFQKQKMSNATFSTQSSYNQKMILKQGRADAYKMRAKGKK